MTELLGWQLVVAGSRWAVGQSWGAVTNYLVDKGTELRPGLEERNSSDGLLAVYVYGDDLIESQTEGGDVLLPLAGVSALALTTTEQVTDRYTYDAFGSMPLNSVGNTQNNYLFDGEQYDANIGSSAHLPGALL